MQAKHFEVLLLDKIYSLRYKMQFKYYFDFPIAAAWTSYVYIWPLPGGL